MVAHKVTNQSQNLQSRSTALPIDKNGNTKCQVDRYCWYWYRQARLVKRRVATVTYAGYRIGYLLVNQLGSACGGTEGLRARLNTRAESSFRRYGQQV